MIIAIHQPQYLPWLGYIDKIDRADIFVLLDTVQYKKNDWINRNKIKTAEGSQWLTVPVSYNHPETINNVKIDNKTGWGKKHLNALITNYSKADHFGEHLDFFKDLYSKEWEYLVKLNIAIIYYLIKAFDIRTEVVLSSDFELNEEPTERLIDICKQLKGDTYLAGSHGQHYMNTIRFSEENIEVLFQDFEHPEYNQLFGDFLPNMSSIDLLFNHSSRGIEIIRKSHKSYL
jgi:hypothetical protein